MIEKWLVDNIGFVAFIIIAGIFIIGWLLAYYDDKARKAEYERLTASMTPEEKLEFDRKIFIASHGRRGKGEE